MEAESEQLRVDHRFKILKQVFGQSVMQVQDNSLMLKLPAENSKVFEKKNKLINANMAVAKIGINFAKRRMILNQQRGLASPFIVENHCNLLIRVGTIFLN